MILNFTYILEKYIIFVKKIMATEKWTKKKILEVCLETIPFVNPRSINYLLDRIEEEKIYFSKITFKRKITSDSKEYKIIEDAIEQNRRKITEYYLKELRDIAKHGDLKAIEKVLMIYGDAEVKQAFNKNYNITAKADISFEQEMKKVEEDLSKFSKEELLQYRALRKKLLNNE
jgi:hypothetical protein